MSSRPSVSKVVKKMVVVEYDKVQGTYMELGPWDEDIGAERYAELLQEGHIQEEDFLDFDGNMLRIMDRPDINISLKNETIFRCYCAPHLQNCRACFMRKRTAFAEGQARLARIEQGEAKYQVIDLKRANAELKEKNEELESELSEKLASVDAEKEELEQNLQKADRTIKKLRDYITFQYRKSLENLPADDYLSSFHRDADRFESEGGNLAPKRRSNAHPQEISSGESESDSETEGRIERSESSESDSDAAEASDGSSGGSSDDEDGDDQGPGGGASTYGGNGDDSYDSGYNGGDLSGTPGGHDHTNGADASSESDDSDDEDFSPGLAGKRRRPSEPSQQAGPATTTAMSPANARKRKAETPESGAGTAPPAKKSRAGAWSDWEKACLVGVMGTHVSAVLKGTREKIHDVRLWAFIQSELLRTHGVDRGAQACRMTWNRGLRESTGIDERLHPDPSRLVTSIQTKKGAEGR